MEKNLQTLNNQTMKEVWEYYNKSFKYRAHVKINLNNFEHE